MKTQKSIATSRAREQAIPDDVKFRALVENSPDTMFLADTDGTLTYVSPGVTSASGFQPEELVGRHFRELIDSSEIVKFNQALTKIKSGEKISGLETVAIGKNGAHISIEINVSPLFQSNKVIGIQGSIRDITNRKRVEEDLRNLSHRMVEAQENERRIIGREMHDVLGQSLTVLKLAMDRAAHAPPEEVLPALREAQEIVDEVVQRMRNISLELRPSMLDDLGLLPTLVWYVDYCGNKNKIHINFKHDGLTGKIPTSVGTAAYRIVQEALANAIHHARVKEATVNAWTDKEYLYLTIEDHGSGFDPARLTPGTSSGFSSMKERVLALGGKILIDSTPGKGTTVSAQLPIAAEKKKRKGKQL